MSSYSETSKVITELSAVIETTENELNTEERSVLIKEVIELQEGLKALVQKVEAVKNDHNQIQSGNQILQTYINNLMASSVLSNSVNGNIIATIAANITPNITNTNTNNDNDNDSNSNNNCNGNGDNFNDRP